MAESANARYAYIDALRGYAVLLVIMVHSSQRIGGLKPLLRGICDQGARGVQLFFVASAITLCMSWNRRHDGVGPFYVRRLFRIAPMFWLAIIYFICLQGLGPRGLEPDGIGLKQIILTFLFAHGFLPSTFSSVVPGGWSIAVEMMFYVVFPLLVTTITSLRAARIAVVVALIPAAIVYGELQSASMSVEPESWDVVYKVFSTLNFVHQLPVFLIRMAAYFVIRADGGGGRRRDVLLVSVSLLPVILVLLAYYGLDIAWAEFGFHASFALAFAGGAIALARYPVSFLVNRRIVWIGKISFSGYLWHLGLISLLPANFPSLPPAANLVVFYLLLTGVTIVASSLTYVVVEKPMIALGNRMLRGTREGIRRKEQAAAAP